MKLLPEEVRAQIPTLHATDDDPDPMACCKLVTPWTSWTLYVIEFDGEDDIYGYATGTQFPELGCSGLREIEAVKGPARLRIERDLYFKPCRLSQVMR